MCTDERLFSGERFEIRFIIKDHVSVVLEFLKALTEPQRKKALFLIERIGNHGPPHDEEKFRHEGNGIYALKAGEVRIYSFFHQQGVLMLTHGFLKNSRGGKKTQDREREQAETLRWCLLKDEER